MGKYSCVTPSPLAKQRRDDEADRDFGDADEEEGVVGAAWEHPEVVRHDHDDPEQNQREHQRWDPEFARGQVLGLGDGLGATFRLRLRHGGRGYRAQTLG